MTKDVPKFDVLVTSYEGALGNAELLARFEWSLLVVDEGHRIKNQDTSISRELKQVTTRRRVVLTGYPLQNNLQVGAVLHPSLLSHQYRPATLIARCLLVCCRSPCVVRCGVGALVLCCCSPCVVRCGVRALVLFCRSPCVSDAASDGAAAGG